MQFFQNQFFVSNTCGPEVKNMIAEAIYERIVKAHKNGEIFRVYMMMPVSH